MKKATPIKDITKDMPGMGRGAGRAIVYELSEPLSGQRTVLVSSLDRAFDTLQSETYIFGYSLEKNKVTDWMELDGSQRGTTSHAVALADAGYEIEEVV